MADASLHEYAWALEIKHPNKTFRVATTDLGRSDAEYTALGAQYIKGIKNTDAVIVRELLDGYYGIAQPSNVTFTLDNSEFSTEIPAGCKLRLESDAIIGLGHGDAVTTWRDLSPDANDATQSVSGEKPLFHTDVLNGYPGVYFDNVDAGMITGLTISAAPFTVVCVYSQESGSSASRRAVAGITNNWLIGPYAGTYQHYNADATDPFLDDGSVVAGTFVIDSVVTATGITSYFHNGTLVSFNANSVGRAPGVIGLGAEATHAEPLDGYIMAVYAWPRQLSLVELQGFEGMLARKYGISGPTLAPGFDPRWEWRQVPAVLRHVDRVTNTVTVELPGILLDAVFQGSEVNVTIGNHDDAILGTLIPTQVVDPTITEFNDVTNDAGAAIPVVWGSGCLVHPPNVATPETTDNPEGYDFLVGYDDPIIEGVFVDVDLESPGLERRSNFHAGAGSPTYASATTFTVTNNQSKRYEPRSMARSRVNSGSAWQYSELANYSGGTVTVTGTLAAFATPTDLEVGDILVFRDEYDGIAMGRGTADLTAFRLLSLEPGGMHVVVSRSGVTNPADVLEEIITNTVWGLSSVNVDYLVDSTFATAATALDTAGLGQAIRGALAWDKIQRPTRSVINEMLMMFGGILGRDTTDTTPKWTLTVDTEPSPATVTFGLGDGRYNNIKRVIRYARRPLGETIRNLVLAWSQAGRYDRVAQSYTPNRYRKRSTCAVTGIGVDRIVSTPWIQQESAAERVAYYIAKILKYGDEQLEIIVGQEGRELTLGQLVHVVVPTYGIDKEMRVGRIARSLTETTLRLHGYDASIHTYDGTQVTTTDDAASNEVTTMPGTGANLLPNASWAAPLVQHIPGAGLLMPHEWVNFNYSSFTSIKFDESEAVRLGTVSGHYGEFVVATTEAPSYIGNPSIVTWKRFAYQDETVLYIFSCYCNQDDGFYLEMEVDAGLGGTDFLGMTTSVATTQVNANGWKRHYARGRVPATIGAFDDPVTHIGAIIGFTAAGTYLIEAPQLEVATAATSRLPSAWKQDRASEPIIIQYSTVTCGGATDTVAGFFPAGAVIQAVKWRIMTTLSGVTGFDVGTTADPVAWTPGGPTTDITAGDITQSTAPANHYATSTDLLVTYSGGSPSTGVIKFKIEYYVGGSVSDE